MNASDFSFTQTAGNRWSLNLTNVLVGGIAKDNMNKFTAGIKHKGEIVKVTKFNSEATAFRAAVLAFQVAMLRLKFPELDVEVPLVGGSSEIQDDANHKRALSAVSSAFNKAKANADRQAQQASNQRPRFNPDDYNAID